MCTLPRTVQAHNMVLAREHDGGRRYTHFLGRELLLASGNSKSGPGGRREKEGKREEGRRK